MWKRDVDAIKGCTRNVSLHTLKRENPSFCFLIIIYSVYSVMWSIFVTKCNKQGTTMKNMTRDSILSKYVVILSKVPLQTEIKDFCNRNIYGTLNA